MQSNTKIEDILRYAYVQEVKAERFYRHLALQSLGEQAAAKLEQLANTEKHHQELVGDWYELVTGKRPVAVLADPEPEGHASPPSGPLSLDAVMRMAIVCERRAEAFYRLWQARAESEEEKDLLELLAEEEADHALVLSQDKALMASTVVPSPVATLPWENADSKAPGS